LPKIDMSLSKLEAWQDLFALAGTIAIIVAIVLRPPGTSPGAFALAVSAILIFGAITLIRRYSHEYNYIVTITPENAVYQYRHARELLGWIKVETVWLCLGMQVMIELFAITTELIMILAFLLIGIMGFIAMNVTLFYYISRMGSGQERR